MSLPDRDDLHVVSRNSNLGRSAASRLISDHVFNPRNAWATFLRLLFLGLGIGFLCTGVILFFAYNWNQLSRFTKLGILESLVLITTLLSVFGKFGPLVKNSLLAGATVLIGAMFAVFGQVYQTGADAYDLFLGWTIAATLWVLISGFPVLWLIYMVLLNVSLGLYLSQAVLDWEQANYFSCFVLLNFIAALFFILLSLKKKDIIPRWLINVVSLAAISFATMGISTGVYGQFSFWLMFMILVTCAGYAAGIFFGYRSRQVFFLSVIPLSVIIIIAAILLRASTDLEMILFVFLLLAGGVTMLIRALIQLQKRWRNEE